MIRCDSFSELPGTPRDELDGEEWNAKKKMFKRQSTE